MSIQNLAGNVVSNVRHTLEGGIQGVSARLQNLLGGAVAQVSSLWDGGFVGINNNPEALKTALTTYINELNDIVNGFNTDAYIDGALKGEAKEAAVEYVKAIKDLLAAYTSTYKSFIDLLENQALTTMTQGDTDNAASIRSDAQDIITEANSIRID